MWRIILFFTVIFSIPLIQFPARTYQFSPNLFFDAAFSLSAKQFLYSRENKPPQFNGVEVIGGSKRVAVFSSSQEREIGKDEFLSIPFLGNGYFRYFKAANDVSFFSPSGEELWKKEFSSYPYPDHRGKVILMLTGDSNRVDIMEPNGSLFGVGAVAGNMMTDVDFASTKPMSSMVFSSGELYVINEQGNIDWQADASETGLGFGKSGAISPEGGIGAIHWKSDSGDEIRIFKKTDGGSKEVSRIRLKNVYPHLIHFALNKNGTIVLLPDNTLFFDEDGDLLWEIPGTEPIYRAAYSAPSYFVFGEKKHMVLLDSVGFALTRMPELNGPARVLPGQAPNSFVIQDTDYLRFYTYQGY